MPTNGRSAWTTIDALQLARYIIGFSWIYHGLVPKLIQIAPLERVMTGSIGLSSEASWRVTKMAGVAEVIFGLVFIAFYRYTIVHLLNIGALLSLFAFVAVMVPAVLLEAFNPITTNFPLVALDLILLSQLRSTPSQKLA